MRPHSPAERATLAGQQIKITARVLVEDADGTYRDLTDLGGIDWLGKIRWDKNPDSPVMSGTVELRRDAKLGGTYGLKQSLAPLVEGSPLNRRLDGSYGPILNPKRGIVIETAETPWRVQPTPADFREVFRGLTDAIDFHADPVVLPFRDIGARLQSTQIETVRSYGSVDGVPLATVLQQILNDNGCADITLYVPDPPLILLRTQSLPQGPVMDALNSLALQSSGSSVRYLYDDAGVFRLTLVLPLRNKTTVDAVFGPDEYLDITQAELKADNIRNAVKVTFTNHVTGQNDSVTSTDPVSILEYGRVFMQLPEDATSAIDTPAEATSMADAAISDLASPPFEQQMRTIYWWPAELGDRYTYLANDTHYDVDQTLASQTVAHELDGGHGYTTIGARAKPAGAYTTWLQLGDRFADQISSGPLLDVRESPGDADETFTWSGGAGTVVLLQIDNGTPAAPPPSPFTVPRDTTSHHYLFLGTKDGVTRTHGAIVDAAFKTGPELSYSIDDSGNVAVYVDGRHGATRTFVVIRADRRPTSDEILAGPLLNSETGVIRSAGTVAVNSTFWIGAISENAVGTQSDAAYLPGQWLGANSTPAPQVTLGTPVVQARQVTIPVTLSPEAQRVEFFVVYRASDPSPGAPALGVEAIAAEVYDWVERGSDGSYQPNITVEFYGPSQWVSITAVVTDALHRRGLSKSIKAQAPGGTPPSAPGQPTLGAPAATANTMTIPLTVPASGAAAVSIRRYLDNVPLALIACGVGAGGTQNIVWGSLAPGTPHVFSASLLATGDIEGPRSNSVTASTTADTSGGGGGTVANGKLPTPTISNARWSQSDQSAILPYALGGGSPGGTAVRVQESSAFGGPYADTGETAVASPALSAFDQGGTRVTKYYRVVAQASGYTDSDPSNVAGVTMPGGLGA